MKIAVVGCGQIADAHIQEAQKLPGVEVVAVCDLNPHMAEQAAARFGVRGQFTDLRAMLNETHPDVVHITTPPSSHLPLGRIALEHGAHLYIEKPFTVNLAEANELVALAQKHGKQVCVGHNNTFDPAYLRLKRLVAEGQLGEVAHIDAMMGYNLKGPFGEIFMADPTHWLHRLPGGLAQNNISHPISLVLGLMPDQHIQVHAHGYRWRPQRYGDVRDKFFDELRILLVGQKTTANITFTSQARPVQMYVQAHGTKSSALVSIDARTLRLTGGANMPGPFAKLQWAQHDMQEAAREYGQHLLEMATAKLHFFEGMKELMRQFYAALEERQPMPIPMTEAVRATAVMDDIIRQCELNDPDRAPSPAKDEVVHSTETDTVQEVQS